MCPYTRAKTLRRSDSFRGFRVDFLSEFSVGDLAIFVVVVSGNKSLEFLLGGVETMVGKKFSEFILVDETVVVLVQSFKGFEGVEKGSSGKSLSDLFGVIFVFDDLVEDLSEKFNSV